MTNGPRVEAIDRALTLLTALAGAGPDGAPLTELAAATGDDKSTAYRASRRCGRGLATQSETTGETTGWAPRDDPRRALPHAAEPGPVPATSPGHAVREADELVHLGVLVGDEVLSVDTVEPERAVRVFSEIGRRISAATSAMGRALLAARGVPHDQPAAYLRQGTLSVDQLAAALAITRSRGFSTELEETKAGSPASASR
jgi:DNA-binding IclR family transcriptional regulator